MDKLRYLKGHTLLFSIIAVLLYLVSCEEKSFDNPYDQNVDIDSLAPYDLEVEHLGINRKKIFWKHYDDLDCEFEVYKKAGALWMIHADARTDTLSWIDTNIQLGHNHSYRVKAVFDKQKSTFSEILEFTADIPAPSNFTFQKLSEESYKLTWEDNAIGEQGYQIDKKLNDNQWETGYAIIENNSIEYYDTNIFYNPAKDIEATYRLSAFYEDYHSDSVITSTNASLTAPSELIIEHESIKSAKLSWTDNSDGEQGYRIERSYNGDEWEEVGMVDGTSFVDSEININTLIHYRVSAFNNAYKSAVASADFDSSIPEVYDAEIMTNTINALEVHWNYDYQGHLAYRVDRKVDDEPWVENYKYVDSSETMFSDEVDLLYHDYSYRIYVRTTWHQSDSTEITIEGLKIPLELAEVEAGSFSMGCSDLPSGCPGDEIPVHTVTLDEYSISKFEITNIQFAEFLNDISCNSDGSFIDDEHGYVEYVDMDDSDCEIIYSLDEFIVKTGKDNYPVVEVTWYGAFAFAHWLGGRLPTEAEWEFAARGGNQSQNYLYSGNNNLENVGWFNANTNGEFKETGLLEPNEIDVYDMSGNVSEWCRDWYYSSFYELSPENNPEGPTTGNNKVIRGGSWFDDEDECRSAARGSSDPEASNDKTGFRVVVQF